MGVAAGQVGTEPLSLKTAQRLFVERNPRVEALRQRTKKARGLELQAGKRPNPTFHFSQEGLPLGRDELSFDDQEFLIWASQPLELGGKRGRRREAAARGVDVREAEFQDFLRRGRAEVARSFVRVHHQQAKRDLVRKLLEEYRGLRQIHQHRLREGDVSGLSHLKIEAEEILYRSKLAQAETALSAAWRRLAAWLDWPDGSRPTLQPPSLLEKPRESLEALRRKALRTRPDLKAGQAELEQARAVVAVRRAEKIPDLNVGGGYKRDFGQNSFYVGIDLPLPLFDRNQGAIAAARAEVEAARKTLQWRRILARKQVEEAWRRFRSQREQASRLEDSVMERLETIVEVTTESYNEGESDLLELLDAMRVQLESSLGFQDLLMQARLSRLDLEEAVGAGID